MPARSSPSRAFPPSSPAPARTTSWSKSSASAPIFRPKFLADLLRRAKDTVRSRLLAVAPPAVQEEIRQVLNEIAREAPPPGRNFGVAEELVKLMKELSELDDAAVYNFAESKKFDEVTVALAVLNDMPVEMTARLMDGPRADLILIPCRSGRLNWPTVESILRNRPAFGPIDEQDAGGRGARLPQTVVGDGAADRAVLAAPQQDREGAGPPGQPSIAGLAASRTSAGPMQGKSG